MRVAIPVFGKRISPRFDFAPYFGLVDIKDKKIIENKTIYSEGWGNIDRVAKLKDLNVDTLICGGLPDYLLGILQNSGIRVIPWIAGNADEALSLFLRDQLAQGMVVCSGRKKGYRCRRGTE